MDARAPCPVTATGLAVFRSVPPAAVGMLTLPAGTLTPSVRMRAGSSSAKKPETS